jgi:hypothetical protein
LKNNIRHKEQSFCIHIKCHNGTDWNFKVATVILLHRTVMAQNTYFLHQFVADWAEHEQGPTAQG